jgi:hypothetical protein
MTATRPKCSEIIDRNRPDEFGRARRSLRKNDHAPAMMTRIGMVRALSAEPLQQRHKIAENHRIVGSP